MTVSYTNLIEMSTIIMNFFDIIIDFFAVLGRIL